VEYVRLGRSGLKVSRLALGCLAFGSPRWMPWILDEAESRPLLGRAVEAGVNFFDTADMYSAGIGEQVLGRALKDLLPRDEVVIASKVFFPQSADPNEGGLSRKHILHAIDRTLTNLGVDHLDLYQIHRFDHHTPIEETLEALNDVVRAGKVRYLGASTMHAWQFAKMLNIQRREGWVRFVSMQPLYNLIYREEEHEMLPLCMDEGVGVLPWSPLAGGFLTGRYTRGAVADTARARDNLATGRGRHTATDHDVVDALKIVADGLGRPAAQVALAWVRDKPGITAPIVGATKLAHLEDALASLEIRLEPDQMEALEQAYRPKAPTGVDPDAIDAAFARHRASLPPTA
jgi:aryl-alcohol dehydrogenase-like predicted oxidoreductase